MPTIDAVPIKITLEFSWGDTDEIQDTGYWAMPFPGASGSIIEWDTAPQVIADKIRDTFKAEFSPEYISSQVKARRVVVYSYEDDLTARRATSRAEAAFNGSTAWQGSATNSLPPQATIVAGLFAYGQGEYVENRGRRRGRMFLPTPGTNAVLPAGLLSTSMTEAWRDNVIGWLNAATGVVDLGGGSDFHVRPIVLSRAGLPAGTAKTYEVVQQVRVGNVIDTQRRRRNKLNEQYVAGDINT